MRQAKKFRISGQKGTDMIDKGMLLEILKQLQKKYLSANEILLHTKGIAEALSRDDRISLQLTLGMRQDEMEKFDSCNHAIDILLTSLPQNEQAVIRNVIIHKKNSDGDGLELKKMRDVSENIQTVMRNCLELDKAMSKRIAGKNSFYSR